MHDTLIRENETKTTHPHRWMTRTVGVELVDGERIVYTSVRCERCRAKRSNATEFEACSKARELDWA